MKRVIRDMQERLRVCLAELSQIRPTALLNSPPLEGSFRFRAELPYLDRTLEVFHRLNRRDRTAIPFDLLRTLTTDASGTLAQVRRITALAEEHPENFADALEGPINELKESYGRISADVARALSQSSERSTALTNAAMAVAVMALVGAFSVLAYYSSHDKAVADALLRAAHRIGLS